MKTTLSLATALLIAATSFAATKVTTTVDFGRSSKNCNGRGICVTSTTVENGLVHAIFELGDDGITLKCTIPQEELNQNAIEGQISGNNFFIQEDSYVFPTEIASKMGAISKVVIPSGQYKALLSNSKYIITFHVTDHVTSTN